LSQKARDIKAALTRKGFKETTGRDHLYYFFHHGDKKTDIFTKISHNATDIDDILCSCMARQVRLTNGQFRRLVDCPLTQEGYMAILMERKFLEESESQKSSS
jgi:hypothetical protein